MFGEISYIGWFHTIVGTAAIIVGLFSSKINSFF